MPNTRLLQRRARTVSGVITARAGQMPCTPADRSSGMRRRRPGPAGIDLCVLKVEPGPGQRIEALEERLFRREAQGREHLVVDFNRVTQRTFSLAHAKVVDFYRGPRLNDRFCVNSDASKVCASRDGNPQEVVGVRDRADIALGPHRRAVRGHGYRSLARTKLGEKLGGTCPAHVEYRLAQAEPLVPSRSLARSAFALGAARKQYDALGYLRVQRKHLGARSAHPGQYRATSAEMDESAALNLCSLPEHLRQV